MAIKDLQDLLTEQLGQNAGTEVFTTVAQTGKDYYCVYFPVESAISSITAISSIKVPFCQWFQMIFANLNSLSFFIDLTIHKNI